MSRKMLINALHAEEARVAIVEDGRLVDLDVEIAGNEQIRGNIYKGVVVRVEPGLQAAFVDIGLKKLGFLQMGELHPENWKWRDDVPEDQRHRRPRIQEVLRRGQELIVQVEKGERDNKGSALTTYASLPGRYMVLMPGSDSSGISRKVEAEGERKKLKEIISEMSIPEGYGYIIRTEAVGRTREELQKDLDSLISLYEGVRTQGATMKGAGLIYQESALIIRTIRDYFSADIDEVLVDSKDVYKDVRECLKDIDPQFEKLVKMHQEKRPIFSRYQLEEQIDLIYEKKVPLKSGGSIFIEPTEALVSIDVNSGKSTGEKGVEDTAFKTNMEAAEEAARQLRLRDLGGLIVIDFIDMRDRKHNAEVEKTLKSALKADKARVNVSRISEFGLLEMSRQRIRQTLNQASTLECPHCDGRGKVKSVEAMALSFLRKVHAAAAKGTIGEVVGSLPLEVAYYLLNRKRHELSQIESDYDIEVTVKGKPSYLLNQMELELVKREKIPQEEAPEKPVYRAPREEAPVQEAVAADGRKKKKKGKSKPQAEPEAAAVALEGAPLPPLAAPAAELLASEPAVTVEGEQEEQKKKRRRKRKRGGKGAAAEAAGEFALEPVVGFAAAPGEPGAAPEMGGEFAGLTLAEAPADGLETEGLEAGGSEETKKKRRRKRRRGGKGGHEAVAGEGAGEGREEGAEHHAGEPAVPAEPVAVSAAAEAGGSEAAASAPEQKAKRPARPRKKAGQAAAQEAQAGAAANPGEGAPVVAEAGKPAEGGAPVQASEPAVASKGAEETAAAEAGKPAKGAKPARGARGAKKAKTAEAAAVPGAAVAAGAPEAAAAPVAPVAVEAAVAAKVPEAAEAPPVPAAAKAPKAAKPPKAVKAPRAPKAAKEAAVPAPEKVVPAEPAPAKAEPVAAAKKRAAKKQAPSVATEASPAPAEPAEAQTKKPRAPRKKKTEA
jgi:ribonuclease E